MTLQHHLAAAGQSPDKAHAWENLILKVAAKAEADVGKLSAIILQILAAGKMTGEACNQLQELGIPLSRAFKDLVSDGTVDGDLLGIELIVYLERGSN